MRYVVENLRFQMFYNEAKGPREWVALDEATRYKDRTAAMHIVRMYPALDLCVLQVEK